MQDREVENVFSMNELVPLMQERLAQGQSVRFSPRGVSMLPMIRQGRDSVVLSRVEGKLKKYDIPLYRRANGQYVLHRVVAAEKDYTCIGDNQFKYEHGIAHEQVIAVVSGFYRGEKLYRVDDVGYQMYCRLWHWSRCGRHFVRRARGWLRRHLLKR